MSRYAQQPLAMPPDKGSTIGGPTDCLDPAPLEVGIEKRGDRGLSGARKAHELDEPDGGFCGWVDSIHSAFQIISKSTFDTSSMFLPASMTCVPSPVALIR